MPTKIPLAETSFEQHESNNFDFLRFLFAVFVIFTHSFFLSGKGDQEPLGMLTGHQVDTGKIALNGFFAISGFLITASWLRSRGLWSYLQKRVLRIYPGFLVVCLLCAFLVGPLGADRAATYFHQLSYVGFIHHALLLDKLDLPPTFGHNPVQDDVNGALWSIKIEFECYLLAALLGMLGALKWRSVPLVLLALGSLAFGADALHLAGSHHLPENVSVHVQYFVYFLAGMVFFLYRDRIPYCSPLLIGAILLLTGATISHTLRALLPLPLVYLLMYAAFAPSAAVSRFGRKRDLSYGLYLYGSPLQQLLVAHIHGAFAAYLLFLTALPVTLACAWASWNFVEKPSLRLKSRASRLKTNDIVLDAPMVLAAGNPLAVTPEVPKT